MNYLLDTSVLIELLRNRPEARSFVEEHINDGIVTSTVCEAEVYEGIYREKAENILLKNSIFKKLLEKFSTTFVFGSAAAEIAGKIRATLAVKGSPVGDIDVLIAATAIANEAILVTKNAKHFQKISGLRVETI